MPLSLPRRRKQTRLQHSPPTLTLSRPTILLACICLLRLHTDFPDHLIAHVLFRSFPDMPLLPTDIRLFFDHTCVIRPRWVREMCLAENDDEIVLGTMELLRSRVLADVSLFPLGAEEGRGRGGLGYIAALVGCESWGR